VPSRADPGAFGALIAAGIPVLLALSSVAAAMGLSALASHLVPPSARSWSSRWR
jgi:RND superfamily putative drug exporter